MMPGSHSVVIHAHFYQPPRDNPWLDQVEREPSAAPAHDWNERIEQECYRAVIAARVPGSDGQIGRILNTLEWISYDVGPTLLEWMETEAPATYFEIIAADRRSAARLQGHGNAIAMPYHHIILPLASRRDKTTEVRWGIADFRRRFGREPEGMWLPETAVDDETLDVLAAEGIKFTIVAPHQVAAPPPRGLPGRYRTGNGREIALFVYDGPISHDVAFGPLIRDANAWIDRLQAPDATGRRPALRSVATDGETYGHHHHFGEMALAATIEALRHAPDARIENYAAFLARTPATTEVELVAPSSWSCSHGVERWRSDCGCRVHNDPSTSQAWRAPLRQALDWLAAELHQHFVTEARRFFPDPWGARDAFAILGAPTDVPVRGRELLEMERHVLRMFTSCGWFFDDLGGIETLQVLKYAARAVELVGSSGVELERGLVERLRAARSNEPPLGTGADLYRRQVKPHWHGPDRVAAGFAAVTTLEPERARHVVGAYLVGTNSAGALEVQHRRTGHVFRYHATVHRLPGFRLEVDLIPLPSGQAQTLSLEAFPERERALVQETLRREALREVLPAESLVRLAHGSTTYPKALADALLRLLPETPGAPGELDVPRIDRVLDLLTLEAQHIPFDAQTRLYRLYERGDGELRRLIRPLLSRFGFSIDLQSDRETI